MEEWKDIDHLIYLGTITNMNPIQRDIIRTFGSKELSEGCLLNNFGEIIKLKKDYKIIQNNESEKDIFIFGKDDDELSLNHNTEILGHRPELFPDVARVAKEKGMKVSYLGNLMITTDKVLKRTPTNLTMETFNFPYNPTLPLIDQSEETLTQLLNLFK